MVSIRESGKEVPRVFDATFCFQKNQVPSLDAIKQIRLDIVKFGNKVGEFPFLQLPERLKQAIKRRRTTLLEGNIL